MKKKKKTAKPSAEDVLSACQKSSPLCLAEILDDIAALVNALADHNMPTLLSEYPDLGGYPRAAANVDNLIDVAYALARLYPDKVNDPVFLLMADLRAVVRQIAADHRRKSCELFGRVGDLPESYRRDFAAWRDGSGEKLAAAVKDMRAYDDKHGMPDPPATMQGPSAATVAELAGLCRDIKPGKVAQRGGGSGTGGPRNLIPIADAAEIAGVSDDTIRRRLKDAGFSRLEKLKGKQAATLDQYREALKSPKDEPGFKLILLHYDAE